MSRYKIALGLFWLSVILCGCWGLALFATPLQKFMNYYGIHGASVFCLAMLINLISLKDDPSKVGRLLGWSILIWAVALVNELAQYFNPSRVLDKWDIFAQSAGAVAAFIVAWWAARE